MAFTAVSKKILSSFYFGNLIVKVVPSLGADFLTKIFPFEYSCKVRTKNQKFQINRNYSNVKRKTMMICINKNSRAILVIKVGS